MKREITVGRKAPEFDLETDTGERLSLKSLRGQTVVLYFYPKDDTTGCTTETSAEKRNTDEPTASEKLPRDMSNVTSTANTMIA